MLRQASIRAEGDKRGPENTAGETGECAGCPSHEVAPYLLEPAYRHTLCRPGKPTEEPQAALSLAERRPMQSDKALRRHRGTVADLHLNAGLAEIGR
jgi:hypothetical protein